MKKTIILLFGVFIMCLTGCGNKSNSELVDIEQFRCQDDIQTVFDVLGEVEMETNTFGSEYYKYENINLFGYNGTVYFDVRDDKKTIQEIECCLSLNNKEFENVLSYFSENYGSYEVSSYGETIKIYVWKIKETDAEKFGYETISIQYNGKKKYTIFFYDSMSSKSDEVYYESLKETEPEEPVSTIIFQKEYKVDEEKFNIFLDEKEGKLKITVMADAKTEEKASILLVTLIKSMEKINSIDGFSLAISCGDLLVGYFTTDDGYIITGINKDGSASLSAPDWLVNEITLSQEEVDVYASEINSVLKSFSEDVG